MKALASEMSGLQEDATVAEGGVHEAMNLAANAQVKVTVADLTQEEAQEIAAKKKKAEEDFEAELSSQHDTNLQSLADDQVRLDQERLQRELDEVAEREAIEEKRRAQEEAIMKAKRDEEARLAALEEEMERAAEEKGLLIEKEQAELLKVKEEELLRSQRIEEQLKAEIDAGEIEMRMLRERELMEEEDFLMARIMAWEREADAMARDREMAAMCAEERLSTQIEQRTRHEEKAEQDEIDAMMAEEDYHCRVSAALETERQAHLHERRREDLELKRMGREEAESRAYAVARAKREKVEREEAERRRRMAEEEERLRFEREKAEAERLRLLVEEKEREASRIEAVTKVEALRRDQVAQCGFYLAGTDSNRLGTGMESMAKRREAWQSVTCSSMGDWDFRR